MGLANTAVKNVIIWGNHSSTQYPDVNHAVADGKQVREAVQDDAWLNGQFIKVSVSNADLKIYSKSGRKFINTF